SAPSSVIPVSISRLVSAGTVSAWVRVPARQSRACSRVRKPALTCASCDSNASSTAARYVRCRRSEAMPFRHQPELELLRQALDTLETGFDDLADSASHYDLSGVAGVLQETARRMQDNYPYHHPRYAGQMLKPPHPVARLAYALSLWLNPNNHALDG